MKMYVNGEQATVDKVTLGCNWTSVFVNGFSACRQIQNHLMVSKARVSQFKTSGTCYRIERNA